MKTCFLGSRWRPHVAIVVSLIACASVAVTQTTQTPNSNLPPASEMQTKGATATQQALPPCPKVRLPGLHRPAAPGAHKVILSWNRSAPSADPVNNAVGYCIYRAGDESPINQDPLCENCEQLNPVAIEGTTCVDNLAKDDSKYYYVVTAINAARHTSLPSNVAPAPIPDENQPGSVPADFPLPIPCRPTTDSK